MREEWGRKEGGSERGREGSGEGERGREGSGEGRRVVVREGGRGVGKEGGW